MSTDPWSTIDRRWVYENPWIRVREDNVIRPDGTPGIYGVVSMRPGVGVVALDGDGRVLLVSQWRYTLGRSSLEIPTGGSEDDDPDLETAARRELREETGVVAATWTSLGTIDTSNGVTDEVGHLFLATGLSADPAYAPQAAEPVTVRRLEWDTAVRMAVDGSITESLSVAALLRADHRMRT
jgi:8-oxo-dGTP pyrophosphatase MutT (NUDIX family)